MSFGLGKAAAAGANATGRTTTAAAAAIDGNTPWVAAADGDLDLLQLSLQQLNLPLHAADADQGYTLLQGAASYSQLHVLHYLLQSSQSSQPTSAVNIVNAVDRDGDSALHYANTDAAAKVLVDAGIDITIRNSAGCTALEAKQLELQELLDDADDDDDADEDVDVVQAKGVIAYLSSLLQIQQ
jgi:ankyrin repeat protein